jgi:hypothetical protein
VNWYAVLGNHDYGDKINPDEDSCAANTLDACPEGCCYSSVWQVSAATVVLLTAPAGVTHRSAGSWQLLKGRRRDAQPALL